MGKHRLLPRGAKLPLGLYLFIFWQCNPQQVLELFLWSCHLESTLKTVVWNPPSKRHFMRKSMDSGRWWLCERRKQRKILLTSETTGNLHTLLHSPATCTRHVHRGGGCGGAPHGTNWKKHRGSENGSAARNHPTRHKRPEEPTQPTNSRLNESGASFSHKFYSLMLHCYLKAKVKSPNVDRPMLETHQPYMKSVWQPSVRGKALYSDCGGPLKKLRLVF